MTNEKECEEFPKGIYGCTEYESSNKCTSCESNRYLKDN